MTTRMRGLGYLAAISLGALIVATPLRAAAENVDDLLKAIAQFKETLDKSEQKHSDRVYIALLELKSLIHKKFDMPFQKFGISNELKELFNSYTPTEKGPGKLDEGDDRRQYASIPTVQDNIKAILPKLRVFLDLHPDASAQIYSDALSRLLNDADAKAKVIENRDATNRLTALSAAIKQATAKPSPPKDKNDAAADLVKLLGGARDEIAKIDAADQYVLIEAFKKEKDVDGVRAGKQAFETAYDTLMAIVVDDLRIYVDRAWYGEFDAHWRDGTRCDATVAFRQTCNAKSSCTLSEASAICGDPAPNLKAPAKGAVVRYACISGRKPVWDALIRNPHINPVTRVAWNLKKDFQTATLTGSAAGIRCSYPADKVAMGGASNPPAAEGSPETKPK